MIRLLLPAASSKWSSGISCHSRQGEILFPLSSQVLLHLISIFQPGCVVCTTTSASPDINYSGAISKSFSSNITCLLSWGYSLTRDPWSTLTSTWKIFLVQYYHYHSIVVFRKLHRGMVGLRARIGNWHITAHAKGQRTIIFHRFTSFWLAWG